MAMLSELDSIKVARSSLRSCQDFPGLEDLRGLDLLTLKDCMVSHDTRNYEEMGPAHFKYVADNDKARRGKVLRINLARPS